MQIIQIKRPMEMKNMNTHMIMNNNYQEESESEYLQLQYIIQAKRNMLLKKQKRIQKIAKQNAFLENNIRDAKIEQNKIVKELKAIKHGLDKVMNEI